MASSAISTQSTVERLGVEPVARAGSRRTIHLLPLPEERTPERTEEREEPGPELSQDTAPPTVDTSAERLAMYRAIASVIAASAAVLSTRLILLLGLIGAFVLAVMAARESSLIDLAILVAYAVLVLVPLVWLETRTTWSRGD